MNKTTRILIADAQPIVRKGLRALLAGELDLEVIGEAAEGVELLRKIEMMRPDVVVLDLLLPRMDALAAIQQIKQEWSNLHLLILTEALYDERAIAAIKAGVSGYLGKAAPLAQVLQAIRDVASGQCPLDSIVAQRLVHEMKQPSMPLSPINPLNPREVEVLTLVAQGLSNREIAGVLILSERTVGNHMSAILSKLQISNRTQATLYALQEGLTTIPKQAIAPCHRKLGCMGGNSKERLRPGP